MKIWPEFVCPLHRLHLTEAETSLDCAAGHRFAIVHGVPRFVTNDSYAAAFGLQWRRYRKTQLDSYSGTTISADRLRRCLGEELWSSLPGQTVLECGCGAGRFTEVLLGRGARVVSIDLSLAVEANQENFPPGDFHRVVQADLMALPFDNGQFDTVICLGTLQHTPSPEASIAALANQLAPAGTLVLDHYLYEPGGLLSSRPVVRTLLKRSSPERALAITEKLVDFLLPFHRAVANLPALRSAVSRLSPVMSYYATLPQLEGALQREWAMLDTYDALTDWYKHRRTPEQIRETLQSARLEDIECWRGGNGIEARARRAKVTSRDVSGIVA